MKPNERRRISRRLSFEESVAWFVGTKVMTCLQVEGQIAFQVIEGANSHILQIQKELRNASVSLAQYLGEANWQF